MTNNAINDWIVVQLDDGQEYWDWCCRFQMASKIKLLKEKMNIKGKTNVN